MNKTHNVIAGLLNQRAKPVDNIPAKLTENEFVIPADVVLMAGHGDPKRGEDFFQKLIDKMRAKTHKKIKKAMV